MAGRMNDKTETGLLGVVLLRSSPIALDPERKVVHREEPQYPALAGKMALHGTAKLKIWISPGAAVLQAGASFHEDAAGRNVFFGVREFAMCAALIGMAAHGGLVSFGSTFSCFADYCKPAIRLAALMGAHSLFVFTHDSLGPGQDGPTHQQPKKEAPPPREPKRTRQH